MTLAQERNVSKLSLRELSIASSQLWEQIEAAQQIESDEDGNADNQVGLIIQ